LKIRLALTLATASLILAGCNTRQERIGGAGVGAMAGAAVAGPVGLVAGGVAGAVAGPSVAHTTGIAPPHRMSRKKRLRSHR
jgi:osmotically inducible lipoprotein OsmB